MSRKAKTLSLSKSFIEGISPVVLDGGVSCVDGVLGRGRCTLNDLAEDAGSGHG
jgi:hypothetical protein